MINRTLSSAITFCLLAVAAVAICAFIVGGPAGVRMAQQQPAAFQVVELPRVVITAKRLTAAAPTAQADSARDTAVAWAD